MQGGRTPLDCADSSECIAALLDGGADCRSPKQRSRNPLLVAVAHRSEPLVRRLLAMGAPVNATDEVRGQRECRVCCAMYVVSLPPCPYPVNSALSIYWC